MMAKFRIMAGGSKLRREVGVVCGFPCLHLPDALTESSSPSRNTPAQCHTHPPPILHSLTSETQKTTASLILPAIKLLSLCFVLFFFFSFLRQSPLFPAKYFIY